VSQEIDFLAVGATGARSQFSQIIAMNSLTEQLVKAFLSCTLPKDKWTHHAHLRVGLWHLLRYSQRESIERLRQGIKQYNVACGIENTESQGYHETITQFYVRLIHQFIQQADCTQPLDSLADELIHHSGDRSLPLKYYSRDKLMSKAARLGWVEPDLMPCVVPQLKDQSGKR
jgi:hypothetical protein